jgi:hypothetical protein
MESDISTARARRFPFKPYHQVPLVFGVISIAWILASDSLTARITVSAADHATVQSVKGLVYVTVVAMILYFVARRTHFVQLKQEREKQEVYLATVAGAYHILANYLHASQLVTLQLEQQEACDRATLQMVDRARMDAIQALSRLQDLQQISPTEIERALREQDMAAAKRGKAE